MWGGAEDGHELAEIATACHGNGSSVHGVVHDRRAKAYLVVLSFEVAVERDAVTPRFQRVLERDGWSRFSADEPTFWRTIWAREPMCAWRDAADAVNLAANWTDTLVTPTLRVAEDHVMRGARRPLRSPIPQRRVGAYQLGRKLGEGGMGVVFEAKHVVLGRRAAVKLVTRSHLLGGDARLLREANLAGALSHPNTVVVYDYGRTAQHAEYIAMELLEGVNLFQLVRCDGAQPHARVLSILRQVAGSLAHAHKGAVIHRDVKPSNVMLCDHDGHPDHVKVLDFGLAARLGEVDDDDCVVGTAPYMAPETFVRARDVGPATDVYAVGVLGYFLLTGTVPFEGRSRTELGRRHQFEAVVPPSRRTAHEVPPDLERLLLRCMAKRYADRPRDGSCLLTELSTLD